tara:strand:- start:729 stop:1019 length:291 start_codon:yes stop_codon:yes gene_type:complete
MAGGKKIIMKNLIFIIIFLFSCEKDQITPIENNIIITETCLDTCGIIIACKYYTIDFPTITSELTVATLCDTLNVFKTHTIEEVQYYSGMEVCFIR